MASGTTSQGSGLAFCAPARFLGGDEAIGRPVGPSGRFSFATFGLCLLFTRSGVALPQTEGRDDAHA